MIFLFHKLNGINPSLSKDHLHQFYLKIVLPRPIYGNINIHYDSPTFYKLKKLFLMYDDSP